jgi:hypothetical protein
MDQAILSVESAIPSVSSPKMGLKKCLVGALSLASSIVAQSSAAANSTGLKIIHGFEQVLIQPL